MISHDPLFYAIGGTIQILFLIAAIVLFLIGSKPRKPRQETRQGKNARPMNACQGKNARGAKAGQGKNPRGVKAGQGKNAQSPTLLRA